MGGSVVMEASDLSSTDMKTVGDDVDLGSASAGLQLKGVILSTTDISGVINDE